MSLDFGWVIQPVPLAEMTLPDLMAYNRTSLDLLTDRFTTIWMEDHFQWDDRAVLEAWTALTYFAALYPRMRVGHIVLGQSYRNPALTAKMAATLQYLTGGRCILGLGAGWKEDEYRAYGYPYPEPKVRVEQLADAIAICRALWTDSPATYHGKHYSVEKAYCSPRPDPMIPIHIGGGGEQLTLRVVARTADAWNGNFITPEAYAHKVEILRGHCQAVGRDPREIALTYYTAIDLPDDPAQATPRNFFTFGPTPAEAIAQIGQFAALGVSHILLRTTNLQTLRRFQEDVLPHI